MVFKEIIALSNMDKITRLAVLIPRLLRSPAPTSSLVLADAMQHHSSELDQLKIRLANQAISSQKELALRVSSIINARVYVFDPTCHFSTPPFDTVLYEDIRTVHKGNKTALLSAAAQSVVPSLDLYLQLIDPRRVSHDEFGVYVKA